MRIEYGEDSELWVQLIDAEVSELKVTAMAGDLFPILCVSK
jgi:hypothetical protein